MRWGMGHINKRVGTDELRWRHKELVVSLQCFGPCQILVTWCLKEGAQCNTFWCTVWTTLSVACLHFRCSYYPLCMDLQYDRCSACHWYTEIICLWPSDTIKSNSHLDREPAGILSCGVINITQGEYSIRCISFFLVLFYTSNRAVSTDMLAPRLHSCHSREPSPAVNITACIRFYSTALI